jgi:osmotically-inducible protein OsmY
MPCSGSTMKRILIPSLLLATISGLQGCARLVAAASGPEPVGVADGERTLSQRVEDLSIERTAAINIYKLDPDIGTKSRVLVMSFYSNVLLAGQVSSDALRRKVEAHIKSMREVNAVHNELALSPEPLPFLTRARDNIISARVRSTLTFTQNFPSHQCKVLVEDGVVYLMAKLNRRDAETAIQKISAIPDVKRIVKLVDYLPG